MDATGASLQARYASLVARLRYRCLIAEHGSGTTAAAPGPGSISVIPADANRPPADPNDREHAIQRRWRGDECVAKSSRHLSEPLDTGNVESRLAVAVLCVDFRRSARPAAPGPSEYNEPNDRRDEDADTG